jgi:hypothetical protein
MNYLKYVEFAAENLQFFLWYSDYQKRFEQLDPISKLLAPEWTAAQIDAEILVAQLKATTGTEVPTIFQGTIFDSEEKDMSNEPTVNPFATSNGSLASDSISNFRSASNVTSREFNGGDLGANPARNYAKTAASAFEDAKLDWQPCMLLYMTRPLITLLTKLRSYHPTISRGNRSHRCYLHC